MFDNGGVLDGFGTQRLGTQEAELGVQPPKQQLHSSRELNYGLGFTYSM